MAKKTKLEKELEEALAAPMKETKVRITTFIDGDVYMALKNMAEEKGEKYQTLLNRALRKAVLSEVDIEDRLARIEKKVFGKKGA